jgi:AcrR family transcriptional regulator
VHDDAEQKAGGLMAGGETVERGTQRGRPRSERSRRAILRAVTDLMLERDLGEISIAAVAERARASKATIYRWWPSKELLALDALRSEWDLATAEAIDTGSLVGDLRALILPWTRELTAKPYGRMVASFVARAQIDPVFAREYREHFVRPRREDGRRALRRAIERGEIHPDTDVEAALDLLYGPFYHRLLHGHAPVTDRFARTIINYVATALSPSKEAG